MERIRKGFLAESEALCCVLLYCQPVEECANGSPGAEKEKFLYTETGVGDAGGGEG